MHLTAVGRSLALLVVGCNAVYGLDATRTRDAVVVADRDGDDVLDEADNCPDTSNPGQEDLDRDGPGDACDPCSYTFGPALDRDGDAIAPAVDNCPAIANATQDDADGDGIGDACDPNPGVADTLRCFDDFSTDVPAVWPLGGPWQWIGTPNAALLYHTPSSEPPFSIAARTTSLPLARGVVQLELQSPSSAAGAETGIAIGAADLSAAVRCELIGTGTGLRLRVSDANGPLQEQPLSLIGQRMLVTLGYRAGEEAQLDCAASRPDGTRQTVSATTRAAISLATVGLFSTNANGLFRSLAIYDTAP